ncbi:MAG: hypothetical protein INR65_21070, partial [Gluconacetobacter diazotrophicus]|nr:hypothetical protein [Gluconacetobacter diazotrophicus]
MIVGRSAAANGPAYAPRPFATGGAGFAVPVPAAATRGIAAPVATGSLAASLLAFQEHAGGEREDADARDRASALLSA